MFDTIRKAWDDAVNYPYRDKAEELLRETPIEVAIGAALGAIIFGGASYSHERAKLGSIPVGYSNYHHDRYNNEVVRPRTNSLTQCYSMTNDAIMQTFESNNEAYRSFFLTNFFGINHEFAKQLERKVDQTIRVNTLISDYAPQVEKSCADALVSLKKLSDAQEDLRPAIGALAESWDEEHDDIYKTEVYIDTCSSADGKSSYPCTKTRQVYDHTDHTYTYYQSEGEKAARLLARYSRENPDIHISDKLQLPPGSTAAENEFAIRRSRESLSGYKTPTQAEYDQYARTWATGSNFATLIPVAYKYHAALLQDTPEWQAAKRTAQSISYSTYRHQDDGPREFQIVQSALSHANATVRPIEETLGGIILAKNKVSELSTLSTQFANVTLHGENGNSSALRGEVMDLSRKIYESNFSGGFDTRPAKWIAVFLFSILGMVLGGGLGLAVDRMGERHLWPRRGYRWN